MRNISRAALLMTLVLLFVGSANSQNTLPTASFTSSNKDLATVYVYRVDDGIVGLWFIPRKLPIYFREGADARDKKKNLAIASLENKRYFVMRLPPGKYIFDTKMMWGGLNLEVLGGNEYYVRADRGNDCPTEDNDPIPPPPCVSTSSFLASAAVERWGTDRLKLKPIKVGDVKDRKLVIIPANDLTH